MALIAIYFIQTDHSYRVIADGEHNSRAIDDDTYSVFESQEPIKQLRHINRCNTDMTS
jgi:hypothetical protein